MTTVIAEHCNCRLILRNLTVIFHHVYIQVFVVVNNLSDTSLIMHNVVQILLYMDWHDYSRKYIVYILYCIILELLLKVNILIRKHINRNEEYFV